MAASADGGGTTKPCVAVLGIGLMGNKMARRLQQQGFQVAAWNRTSDKAAPLAEVRRLHASLLRTACGTAAQIAERCFTALGAAMGLHTLT